MKLHGQAISVPKPGKLPNFLDREDLSAFEMVVLTPLVDPFLRPEEQHRRSGEDQIIVPAGERDGEVYKQPAVRYFAIPNFQLNSILTFRENRINLCITAQRAGDSEHVPGTVGEIDPAIRIHLEIRGNCGERVRHADVQRAWFEEEGVTVV